MIDLKQEFHMYDQDDPKIGCTLGIHVSSMSYMDDVRSEEFTKKVFNILVSSIRDYALEGKDAPEADTLANQEAMRK